MTSQKTQLADGASQQAAQQLQQENDLTPWTLTSNFLQYQQGKVRPPS